MAARTIRILSIDGGGIRGIIPATLLDAITGGRPAQEVFHMVAGTSTGGIIACGLAKPNPMSPGQLVDLYAAKGGRIFDRPAAGHLPWADLLDERYPAGPLEDILASELGDAWLSDVAGIDLLVPAYCVQLPGPKVTGETRSPYFFASWKARGEGLGGDDRRLGLAAADKDFRLRDVCRATSAAPTYFEPADVRNRRGDRFGFIDGGVFANNPAMCALAAAHRRYGQRPGDRVVLVSLGTGYLQRPIDLDRAKGWGVVGWARPMVSIMMDGNSDTVCAQASEVLGAGHHRFDIALGVAERPGEPGASDDLDDASGKNIRDLQDLAAVLLRRDRDRLAAVAAELAGPRCPV